MPSGPAALRGLTRLNVLLTLAAVKERPQDFGSGLFSLSCWSYSQTKVLSFVSLHLCVHVILSGSVLGLYSLWCLGLHYESVQKDNNTIGGRHHTTGYALSLSVCM